MNTAAHKCATSATLKSRSLLRAHRYYSTADLVMLYKSHVLSFIEYRTPGLHFASASILNQIDDVQARFLRQINVSEESAFMHFNLAPLTARRDIAILGCIHRAARQRGPPSLLQFFSRNLSPHVPFARRAQRHSFQIVEWPRGRDLLIMRRSALRIIRLYNVLQQKAIENATSHLFKLL